MTIANFTKLLNFWESLRFDGNVPFRSDLDPRQIPDALENIFILENVAPDQFRVRHSGMMLCEMMGFEVRGQRCSSMMQDNSVENMLALLGQVLARPCVVELTLDGLDLNGDIILLNMIFLPMRSDFGDVNRVLGCISTPVKLYAAPLRFAIVGQKVTPIEIDTIAELGFAEEQAAFGTSDIFSVTNNDDPEIGSEPRRGHLRLVGGSDQDT